MPTPTEQPAHDTSPLLRPQAFPRLSTTHRQACDAGQLGHGFSLHPYRGPAHDAPWGAGSIKGRRGRREERRRTLRCAPAAARVVAGRVSLTRADSNVVPEPRPPLGLCGARPGAPGPRRRPRRREREDGGDHAQTPLARTHGACPARSALGRAAARVAALCSPARRSRSARPGSEYARPPGTCSTCGRAGKGPGRVLDAPVGRSVLGRESAVLRAGVASFARPASRGSSRERTEQRVWYASYLVSLACDIGGMTVTLVSPCGINVNHSFPCLIFTTLSLSIDSGCQSGQIPSRTSWTCVGDRARFCTDAAKDASV
ncbi:hypothetical protein PsYK624_125640 [Phanerochaete sordida]|uniref:Uncharacterized protein n=1 Tax=Phanerochaete sordida TaxID=48140 RepID=A0A9P3LJ65_9APHY|nr:hypothetical protein PsYK624_125640 [Phanerochaete sordida]